MPEVVEKWLKNMPELPGKKACLFTTFANKLHVGWALSGAIKILKRKKIEVNTATTILMPSSFTVYTDPMPLENAKRLVSVAERSLSRLAADITAGKHSARGFYTPWFLKPPYFIMHLGFRYFMIPRGWKRWKVSDACTSCGACSKACPVKAITMENGRPAWRKGCQQCEACFNVCPVKAITQLEWLGKGSKRGRYIFNKNRE